MRAHRHVRIFGSLLRDPNLWHLNRRSVAGAVAIAVFVAFLPVPGQMLLAALLAIAARVNLIISAAGVWVSNPLTMPAMFYISYRVGAAVLGRAPEPFHFEFSLRWFLERAWDLGPALFIGGAVVGIVASALAYLVVRLLWRLYVIRQQRSRRRGNKKSKIQNL